MTTIYRQSTYKWEYPLIFYFMNTLRPGFTVLAPELTCNKQCSCESAFRRTGRLFAIFWDHLQIWKRSYARITQSSMNFAALGVAGT